MHARAWIYARHQRRVPCAKCRHSRLIEEFGGDGIAQNFGFAVDDLVRRATHGRAQRRLTEPAKRQGIPPAFPQGICS